MGPSTTVLPAESLVINGKADATAALTGPTSLTNVTLRNGESASETPKKVDMVRKLPTFEELRAAVPKECFEKSLKNSLFFLLFDYTIIGILYSVVPIVENYGGWPGLLVWYWVIGMFMSALFVVGHDCGHGTFSNYTWVNDIFGHVAHAPLMVPYWPWQKSHRQHHQYTSHIEKDRGHPWITEDYYYAVDFIRRHFHKLPISGFIKWNPIYTLVGLPDGSHFWPFSNLFVNNRERLQCFVSGAACALCSYIAYALCDYSVYGYFKYYYVPLTFQGFWLVMFTYLQHQDEQTEVYENKMWSFVTGQMQTIDLKYGFGVDWLLHHITDGHVAHHLFFTKIPHYKLPVATKAVREVLERYPGVYKSRTCYAYVYDFLRLNIKLNYLIAEGNGIYKYSINKKASEGKSVDGVATSCADTKSAAAAAESASTDDNTSTALTADLSKVKTH